MGDMGVDTEIQGKEILRKFLMNLVTQYVLLPAIQGENNNNNNNK